MRLFIVQYNLIFPCRLVEINKRAMEPAGKAYAMFSGKIMLEVRNW